MNSTPTIRELAELAGVSRTTVSLALRNSPKISKSERTRIQKIAQDKQYRIHPMVSALMTQVGRKKKIKDEEFVALIHSGKTEKEWAENFWIRQLVEGAKKEAYSLGFRCEVFWAGCGGCNSLKLSHQLFHRGIRCLLFAPIPYPHETLQFDWEHFISVTCTYSPEFSTIPLISANHKKDLHMALDKIYERGAKSAGFMCAYRTDERLGYAFSAGAWSFKQQHPKFKMSFLNLNKPDHYDSFEKWYRRYRPEVLILDSHVIPIAEWVERAGDKLGKDVGYMLLDVDPKDIGKTAGILQKPKLLGKEAIKQLNANVYSNAYGLPEYSIRLMIQSEFVDGSSLDFLKTSNN